MTLARSSRVLKPLVTRLWTSSIRQKGVRKPQIFWQTPAFTTTVKMSSMGGASIGAGLYAVVSSPAQIGTQPEEAKERQHHLKNGKGFTNPWDSYVESSFWELVVKGIWW